MKTDAARKAAKKLRTRADSLRAFANDFDAVREERAYSACLEAAAILRDAAKETESPVADRYAALDAP